MKQVALILAKDEEDGIWKDWDLAWYIPNDLKYFQKITSSVQDESKQNAVIMWRKTWDSIPEKYRPFKNRKNIILTRNLKRINVASNSEVLINNDIDSVIRQLQNDTNIESIFIIGWAEIYKLALSRNLVDVLYITQIEGKYNCDTFVWNIESSYDIISQSDIYMQNDINYQFKKYKKAK